MPNQLLDENAFEPSTPVPPKRSQKEKDLFGLKIYSIALPLIISISFVYIKYYYPIKILGVELNPKEETISEGDAVTIILVQMFYLCLWALGAMIFCFLIIKTLKNSFLGALKQGYKNIQESPIKKDLLFVFFSLFFLVMTVAVSVPLFFAALICISLVLFSFIQGVGQFGDEFPIYSTDIVFYMMTFAVFGIMYFLFRKQIRE